MFNDNNNQTNTNTPNSGVTPNSTPTTPVNPTTPPAVAVEDIFSDTDKASEAPINQNSGQVFPNPFSNGSTQANINQQVEQATVPAMEQGSKLLKIVAIAMVVLVVIIGVAAAVYKFLKGPSQSTIPTEQNNLIPVENNNQTPTQDNQNNVVVPPIIEQNNINEVVPSVNTNLNTIGSVDINTDSVNIINTETSGIDSENSTPTNITPEITQPVIADSDNDGLNDSEEATLGTNPLQADSDSDDLSDYQEETDYKNNPLKADTDGDGYSDGAEIKGGYNPNGAGKL
ncbi:MAG: thrombospondin type 3 repeat-containing protein [Planctomycetes bacterium]|nr:thrombospondin type 3 repeat-containing protein [Planctomycetota bacterium]